MNTSINAYSISENIKSIPWAFCNFTVPWPRIQINARKSFRLALEKSSNKNVILASSAIGIRNNGMLFIGGQGSRPYSPRIIIGNSIG